MDRRCLFVESDRVAEIRMDGPAVRIRAYHRSWQWFPLRRVSRVLCLGLSEASVHVWIEVASYGIPVLFVRPNGRILAQLSFPGATPAGLSHWMGAAMGDEEVRSAYELWLDNWLRHSYGLLGAISCDRHHAQLRAGALVARLARQQGVTLSASLRKWCDTLVYSQILEQAIEAGLPSSGNAVSQLQNDLGHAGSVLAQANACRIMKPGKETLDGVAFARLYEQQIEQDVQTWLQRAFYSLKEALEQSALYGNRVPKACQ